MQDLKNLIVKSWQHKPLPKTINISELLIYKMLKKYQGLDHPVISWILGMIPWHASRKLKK